MAMTVDKLLSESGISFGRSGARGLVTLFSADVCAAFTQGFIAAMCANYRIKRVAVAVDNRPSSPYMASACIGMLQALGLEVDFYGVLPTPALAYQAMLDKVPAMMITGSHIPFDRNGIKFYRPDGEISKEDEHAILSVHEQLQPYTANALPVKRQATESYIQRYLSFFPSQMLRGKHIGIYEHSSAGRDLYYRIFEGLGARVTRLEPSDCFVPIDTEAVSEQDKLKARQWAQDYQFDAIFTTDGDGDRPLMADEHGQWLRGDILGLLTARSLGISSLALPINCNLAVEKSHFFHKTVRTRIGSPYVIAAFDELKSEPSYAGFEANGGFLLGSEIVLDERRLLALPTRDAMLPALAILALAGKQSLSQLVASLPKRYTESDRLQNVPVGWSQTFIRNTAEDPADFIAQLFPQEKVLSVNQTDGLRITLSNGDVVHLRPSGNAPELRCYADSGSEFSAGAIVKTVLNHIKQKLL